jgi:hypothetical protein
MKIRIFNNFHNTEATVVLKNKINKSCGYVSARVAKECKKKLCGINGCTCGTDDMGGRGNSCLRMEKMYDGSVCIWVDLSYLVNVILEYCEYCEKFNQNIEG